MAAFTDAHLINPWGLSRGASSPWWVSDEATGVSTLYNGAGAIQSLVVTVPPISGTGAGTPTGTVALGSDFVFVTLDGTISEWAGGTSATIKVKTRQGRGLHGLHNRRRTAQYRRSTSPTAPAGWRRMAPTFHPITLAAGAFEDPSIPAGYTPYGIQAVGAKIYVTFSAAPGAGGYVDAFNPAGTLLDICAPMLA
jgi:hypothetical protein